MKSKPARWASLAGAAVLLAATAQAAAPDSRWFYRAWQSQDGLPDNSVTGIAQTPDGFLWTATPGGLARFDGVSFHDYAPINDAGAPGSQIEALHLDRLGRLWVAKTPGIILCKNDGQLIAYTNGPSASPVMIMAEDGEGALWINYADGQLARIRDQQLRVFTARDGWPSGPRSWVTADVKGQLWFIKAGALGVFRNGKFVSLEQLRGEQYCLTAARGGGLWINGRRELWKHSEADGLRLIGPVPTFFPHATATAVLEDRSGAVWMGTAEAGLFRYDATGFLEIKTSHREILSLTEDREGNIWVGTRLGGLNRLRQRALELENVLPGLPNEAVLSVCQDRAGDLWATTQSGLVAQRRSNIWNVLSADPKWFARYANCIAPAANGGVWIGTQRRGLTLWQAGTNAVIWRAADGLASDFVRSLQSAANDDLWIGFDATNVLQRLRDGRWTTFSLPNTNEIVSAMITDPATNLWVSTSAGRLLRLRGDQLVDETPQTPTAPRPIRCLEATADGSLWLGYAGSGVGRLKAGEFTLFNAAQGLRDAYISQILADDKGRLWLAGNRGLFYVKQSDFDDVGKGLRTRLRWVGYDQEEGLPRLLGGHGQWPGASHSQEGRLYFPTQNGLASLAPDLATENHLPPPVLLMQVIVDGAIVATQEANLASTRPDQAVPLDLRQLKEPLQVPPGNQETVFEFTALSFSGPGNVRFKYQLEGLDKDWVNTQTRRTEKYRHLDPGDYRFRVIACNNDGVWNELGASLAIHVVPYFWQTWWFRTAAVLLILGANGALARYWTLRRMRRRIELLNRERAVENERSRIAQDIHDDIGANLTEITLLSELAQSEDAPPEEVKSDIRKIATRARELTRAVDATVWAVNPRYDNFDSFVSYACTYAEDYLTTAAIRLRLEVPAQLPSHPLAPNVRHNVFLILKEALHNIVKHAAASEVWLRIILIPDGFRVIIQDNGQGFDLNMADAKARLDAAPLDVAATQKDGLFNMRKRMEDIGGQFELATHPGSGTTLTLHVNFRQR